MPEKFAYRGSDEFAAAVRRQQEAGKQFVESVVVPFDQAHPDTSSLWTSSSIGLASDRKCVGFKDPGGKVPAGLSRSQSRAQLIPARGKAGDEWREAMRQFEKLPTIGTVFRDYGVEDFIVDVDHGRVCRPGVLVTDDGVWLIYSAKPKPSPHLTEIKVSEFYAAVEADEHRRAAA